MNIAKTSIPGTHQESISTDEGQLTFCPTASIFDPRGIASRDSLRVAILSLSRSPKTKSGLMMGLTILSTRGISFLKEVSLERWTSVFYRLHFPRLFLIVRFNSLAFDIVRGNYIDICCAFYNNNLNV